MLARGVVGDITDEELLLSAGIDTCDTVVVATGENLESSVLAVMHCKSLGVPTVIAKVKSHTAKKVLEKIGADAVISPEFEMGRSLAQTILFGIDGHGRTSDVEFIIDIEGIANCCDVIGSTRDVEGVVGLDTIVLLAIYIESSFPVDGQIHLRKESCVCFFVTVRA